MIAPRMPNPGELFGGDVVMDRRRAGQSRHGERACAQRLGANEKPFRQVSAAQQVQSERVQGEDDYERVHAAVGQYRARAEDNEQCAVIPEFLAERGGN